MANPPPTRTSPPSLPSPTASTSPHSPNALSPSVSPLSPGSQGQAQPAGTGYFKGTGPTSPRLETIKEGARHGSISFGPEEGLPHRTDRGRSGSSGDGSGNGNGGSGGNGNGGEGARSGRRGISFGSTEKRDGNGNGKEKPKLGRRRSGSSPPPQPKYSPHVSFSNVVASPLPSALSTEPSTAPAATEHNAIAFTLNAKHEGYQFHKSSRTFLCGTDENSYSDYALQWMLDEMVDDGDQIICVRVLERPLKSDKGLDKWREVANEVMANVERRNTGNRAVRITVELAVGKLHTTFTKMIQIYEPSMLIVGTRGRSLGGMQSLISNRNSFSKWCLQYSPIPVVVVRPSEKREKKREKRAKDPNRQSYAQMLAESGLDMHEANSVSTPNNEQSGTPAMGQEVEVLEPLSKEEEMHKVAAALGLPSRFDPLVKEVDLNERLEELRSKRRGSTSAEASALSSPAGSRGTSPAAGLTRGSGLKAEMEQESGEEGDDDADDEDGDNDEDDEGTGKGKEAANTQMVDDAVKKEKLAKMEKGEAAALAMGRERGSVSSVESAN